MISALVEDQGALVYLMDGIGTCVVDYSGMTALRRAVAKRPAQREHHIPDFSHWKDHDAFESAFARLLRDLRAAEATE